MLLFVETQSAQNIFVNQWCAINGQVLFLSFDSVFGIVNSIQKKREWEKEMEKIKLPEDLETV